MISYILKNCLNRKKSKPTNHDKQSTLDPYQLLDTNRHDTIKWFEEYQRWIYYDIHAIRCSAYGVWRVNECIGYYPLSNLAFIDNKRYDFGKNCIYNPKLKVGYYYFTDLNRIDYDNPVFDCPMMHKRYEEVCRLHKLTQFDSSLDIINNKQCAEFLGDNVSGPIVSRTLDVTDKNNETS